MIKPERTVGLSDVIRAYMTRERRKDLEGNAKSTKYESLPRTDEELWKLAAEQEGGKFDKWLWTEDHIRRDEKPIAMLGQPKIRGGGRWSRVKIEDPKDLCGLVVNKDDRFPLVPPYADRLLPVAVAYANAVERQFFARAGVERVKDAKYRGKLLRRLEYYEMIERDGFPLADPDFVILSPLTGDEERRIDGATHYITDGAGRLTAYLNFRLNGSSSRSFRPIDAFLAEDAKA